MGFKFTVTYTGPGPGSMTKREFNNNILKPAYHAVGLYHHRVNTPKRFTSKLRQAPYFTKRKKAYSQNKARRYGHVRPLEFTGQTRKGAKFGVIRATSKGVKVSYRWVKALNYRNKKAPATETMSMEFRNIPKDEIPQLERIMRKAANSRLKQYRKQVRETVS